MYTRTWLIVCTGRYLATTPRRFFSLFISPIFDIFQPPLSPPLLIAYCKSSYNIVLQRISCTNQPRCISISLLAVPPHRVGHNALTAVVCLSRTWTYKKRTEGRSRLEIDRKEPIHGRPVLSFGGIKVKGQSNKVTIRYTFTHFLRRPDEWTVTRFGM